MAVRRRAWGDEADRITTSAIHRQLRHDVWSTKKLLAHCRGLTDAQLALSTPGTFGTIRRTLQHIVGADEDYLKKLGIATVDPLLPDEEDVPLDRIASELELVYAGVERLFAGGEPDPQRVVDDSARQNPADPPLEMDAWLLLAQFAHHGSDHRAHIGTILGAHGLETPRLDVWSYGSEIGALREKARR